MPSWGGHPKTFPLTSLIMRLQHLTSVCRVWMANANSCISQLAHDELIAVPQGPSGLLCELHCVLPLSVWVFSCGDDSSLYHHFISFFFSFQKPWMIWGPVVAVALTAVTAAALFRTWGQHTHHTKWIYICHEMSVHLAPYHICTID